MKEGRNGHDASPLGEVLARYTREGELYEKLRTTASAASPAATAASIPPGRDGICRVRFNEAGTLRVPFGYVGALQLDPVEKKPFFHASPARRRCPSGCWAATSTAATARTG